MLATTRRTALVSALATGGLAAFGVPAAIGVPSVLLYRVLTCWLPVFVGWPIMRAMWRCVTCESSCASTDASSSGVRVTASRPRCTPM